MVAAKAFRFVPVLLMGPPVTRSCPLARPRGLHCCAFLSSVPNRLKSPALSSFRGGERVRGSGAVNPLEGLSLLVINDVRDVNPLQTLSERAVEKCSERIS